MKKNKNQKKGNSEVRRDKAKGRISASVAKQITATREAQAFLSKVNGKTVTTSKRAPKKAKEVVARVRDILHPDSDLGQWAQILSEPFRYEGVFCPVSYNPAPSFIQSTARTTTTNLNGTIVAGQSTQYTFFPGHFVQMDDFQGMDGVSYHALDLTIGAVGVGTRYVVGPIDKQDAGGVRTAIGGTVSTGLPLTGSAWDTTYGGTVLGLPWDVPLPYLSDTRGAYTKGGHSRWQMVSMGIRFRQTTPELNRGGSFVTVQPNNNYMGSNGNSQAMLERFPTFRDHGPEGFEISWIPRAQDLAFWHGTDVNSSSGTTNFLNGSGILVFVNNPTASSLSFTYEVVAHWQLAGSYLNTVGRPGAHSPESKPAVEKAISVLQNGHPSAAAAKSLISMAVSHNGATSPKSWFDTALGAAKQYGPRVAAALAQ